MKLYIDENLKKLRAAKNVTQETLADYLGVTYQAVSRWEVGAAYPDIELLPEIARFFSVSLEELIGTEGDIDREHRILDKCNELEWDGNYAQALSNLRQLEREFPNDWYVKMRICQNLVKSAHKNYDGILPELRQYAFSALKHCSVKDSTEYNGIMSAIVMAVPEEEVDEWAQYLSVSARYGYYQALQNRYRERGDFEQAKSFGSRMLLENIGLIEQQYRNHDMTAEENITFYQLCRRLEEAVGGTPYIENGRVHNSVRLFRMAIDEFRLAAGYAGAGKTEEGIKALEEGTDLWLLMAEASKQDVFDSDLPYLEPEANNHFEDRMEYINWPITALTIEHGWEWFAPIRNDARFHAQLERLYAKKAELEKYWADRK